MDVIKISVDGELSIVNISEPYYKSISDEIGGFEIVCTVLLHDLFPEPVVMVVDDDGFAHNQEYNYLASGFYPGYIFGDVILVPERFGEFEEFYDINEVFDYLESLR